MSPSVPIEEAPSTSGRTQASRLGVDTTGRGAAPPIKMSTWNLITLSLAMLGAQIAWTVELGYGHNNMRCFESLTQMGRQLWNTLPSATRNFRAVDISCLACCSHQVCSRASTVPPNYTSL